MQNTKLKQAYNTLKDALASIDHDCHTDVDDGCQACIKYGHMQHELKGIYSLLEYVRQYVNPKHGIDTNTEYGVVCYYCESITCICDEVNDRVDEETIL
jgi:hypothetical protein